MDNQQCPMKTGTCSTKKWFIASIVAFAVTMGFDWLVHGQLLMDDYKATAALWRPEESMKEFFPYCLAMHAAMAMIFAAMYSCWRSKVTLGAVGSKDCPYKKSMGFGLMIGAFVGIHAAGAYMYLAIPGDLAVKWLVAEMAKWALAGAALSALCKGTCTSKAGA